MEFEWNSNKALINLKKHAVSFEEAQSVFDDPLARIFDDELHSVEESRELIIGHSSCERLLIVSFTERHQNIIRIISARQTTIQEQKNYETYRGIC